MKLLLSIFFFFLLSHIAWADHGRGVAGMDKFGYTVWYSGARYTQAMSGNITITMSSPVGLVSGDSLFVTSASALGGINIGATGTPLNGIYVDFTGATFSHSVASGLIQAEWIMHNCVVNGIKGTDWFINIKMHSTHDDKLSNWHVINSGANVSTAKILEWDWPYNSDMVFTGSKSQTFYNDSLVNCYFDGFLDVNPIAISSGWGGGTEPNRSIALDFRFIGDTILNMARSGGGSVGAISGTGFSCVVDKCVFSNVDGPSGGAHNETIQWFGTIKVIRTKQHYCYASLLRSKPFAWTGLGGTYRNDSVCFIGNITDHQWSYTPDEAGGSNMGNRDAAHGFFQCKYISAYNTTFSTHERSYNPPGHYYGFAGADNEGIDTTYANFNAGDKIELDWADFHASWDSAGRGFVIANVGTPPPVTQKIGNRIFLNYSTHIFLDTISYRPGDSLLLPTPGKYYNIFDKDIEGNVIPLTGALYAGAVQPVSAGSPPGCATYGTVTSIAQTTATINWTAGTGSPTSYDIIVGGVTVGNTTSTSYNLTGLTANSTITYKVVPINASGSATGCSASTFNTLPNPPACTTNLLPANATTVVGTTAATFTWNAASGATSYQFWLDGALVTSLGATTYNGFGYAPGSTHSWYVVPTNSGGSASGCSSSAFTFTTAVAPTVGILLIPRK